MLLSAAFGALAAQPSVAQTAPDAATPDAAVQPVPDSSMQISWQVRNRFRLFREERDFTQHEESLRGHTILASEQALELQSDGRGWARNTVARLCIDANGRIAEPCMRDNVRESYLTPAEHPVTVRLTGEVPVGAVCAWTFDDGDAPLQSTQDCAEPINFRARYGRPTVASVDVSSGPDAPRRVSAEIMVRDILIAGLGDSIASGEGNPDRPIALSEEGFCFRSYLGGVGGQFYRPGRAGYKGDRTCEISPNSSNALAVWQRSAALWFNAACHRSLYSYQTRTALALALLYPHIAVTYLPLACTGATIADGMLGAQRARECPAGVGIAKCRTTVAAQLAELRATMGAAKKRQPARALDLVLLTVGANDINFSGLVADVIVDSPTERALFRRSGVLGSLEDSRASLTRELPGSFARLREGLKPLLGDLARVVYVSYANPALAEGAPCPGGRAGFDIHPAFYVDPQRIAGVANFVQHEFLPQMKSLATCRGGVLCRDQADRMTFVDVHQPAFGEHGMCVRAAADPVFDRECFSATGESFNADPKTAAEQPLTCNRAVKEFRAYLPRGRWIRDANDSYFSAMTYPQGLPPTQQPADIHDATWGVLSAVYGGAVHPTAEGHAAMADAALPAAVAVLGLDAAATGEVGR